MSLKAATRKAHHRGDTPLPLMTIRLINGERIKVRFVFGPMTTTTTAGLQWTAALSEWMGIIEITRVRVFALAFEGALTRAEPEVRDSHQVANDAGWQVFLGWKFKHEIWELNAMIRLDWNAILLGYNLAVILKSYISLKRVLIRMNIFHWVDWKHYRVWRKMNGL